ncbi:MYG1 protein [Phlebotomus argentipes]|uniref:MYG1 protein n=1 Tax=Phlebotomus argentipes TaxID=94469 RepID=UPI0028936AC8|nr:MYG1 protein [Phlebotomus argentipes]
MSFGCLRLSASLFRTVQRNFTVNTASLSFSGISASSRVRLYSKFRYSRRVLEIMSEEKGLQGANLKIGTHDGKFHCDEVLACFMLRQLDKYRNAEIVRTRKDEILDQCDIVVDVGGVFNKEKLRFDHHQKSFGDSLSSLKPEVGDKYTIRLSSAGLIYVYFGEDIISTILFREAGITLDKKSLAMIYKMVYEKFIQEIDAIDNGVPMYPGEERYSINTNINSRIGDLNGRWMAVKTPFDTEAAFRKAMDVVGNEFIDKIIYYSQSWLPARSIVEDALKNRFKTHESGSILILEQFCPWKEHLAILETEQKIEGSIKYVIFNDKEADVRCMAVPITPDSVICRKFLHKDWRGLRGDELEKISGIEKINFVHHNGFIGGAFNREAALKMAEKSLLGNYTD